MIMLKMFSFYYIHCEIRKKMKKSLTIINFQLIYLPDTFKFFILQTFSPRLIIMRNQEHKTLLIQLAKLFTYYNSLDHSRSFKYRENSSQF